MNLLEFFFSGFGVGALFGVGCFIIRFGIRFVREMFDSPAWEDI